VTPDRVSLGQDTVSAIRLVKEAIRIHGDGTSIRLAFDTSNAANSSFCLFHSTYKDHVDKRSRKLIEMQGKRTSTLATERRTTEIRNRKS